MEIFSEFFVSLTEWLPKIGVFLAAFLVLQLAVFAARPVLRWSIAVIDNDDGRGVINVPEHMENGLVRIGFVLLELVAFTVAMRTAGFTSNEAFTLSGIVGIAISFAVKDVILDVFGGIYALAASHIQMGYWLDVDGHSGFVTDIGLFKTQLTDPTGIEDYIANRQFFNQSLQSSGTVMTHHYLLDCNPDAITPIAEIALSWARDNPALARDEITHKTIPPAWVLAPGASLTGSGVTYILAMSVDVKRFGDSVQYASNRPLSEEIYAAGHTLSVFDIGGELTLTAE